MPKTTRNEFHSEAYDLQDSGIPLDKSWLEEEFYSKSDLLQLKNSIIENIERREFSIKGTQYSGLVYSIDLYNMLNDVFDSLINGLDKDEVKNGN